MTSITELARPKVNLTLRVLGRRADGYHELESLVAFACDIADAVTLTPRAGQPHVVTNGPFAGSIAGANLIDVTLARIQAAAPTLRLGDVALYKRLPVAAGIGGGSADAAAVLRAVRTLNGDQAPTIDWLALAASLGADVPVCVASSARLMRGIGERLEPLTGFPELAAVLVNPWVAVPPDKTAQVFRALKAPPLRDLDRATPSGFCSRADLLAHMRAIGNDLLAPAIGVVPAIRDVLEALEADPQCEVAQLSGGGPTCFGIYPDMTAAHAASAALRAKQPRWWIVATRLA